MPTPSGFRISAWDPILIISQIISLQTAYYLSISLVLLFVQLLTGGGLTLDKILSWREIRLDTGVGWGVVFAFLGNSGLRYVVSLFAVTFFIPSCMKNCFLSVTISFCSTVNTL